MPTTIHLLAGSIFRKQKYKNVKRQRGSRSGSGKRIWMKLFINEEHTKATLFPLYSMQTLLVFIYAYSSNYGWWYFKILPTNITRQEKQTDMHIDIQTKK